MAFRILRTDPAKATVFGVAALALGALALETHRTLQGEYRDQVEALFMSVEKAAQQLATRTTETFDQVSRSTLVVNYVHSRRPAPSLTELERAGVIDKGIADPMFIADVAGFVQDATTSSNSQYVADEEFFRQHRVSTDREVLVGQVWTNAVTRAARVPVTRRLEVDGRFYGIVGAMVDPHRLTVPYGRHEASGTVVGVLGEDGYYRSRTVDGHMTFGEKVPPSDLAAQIGNSKRTLQAGRSAVDGVRRFAAMVKVDRYPLYAVVALSADEALAPYQQTRRQTLRWAVGAGLGILLAAAMLLRLARSLDESRRRTRKAEAAFRAALDGSLDAVFILEAVRQPHSGKLVDLRIRDCNGRAAQGLGGDRAQWLGRSFGERLPQATARYLRAFERVMSTRESVQDEMECVDAGLEGLWLHHQLVPLEDGVALISRDVTEKRANEAALAALSRVDSLTALANRRGFEEKLDEALLHSRRATMQTGAKGHLALFYIDLDGFKAINDTLGHAAGDAVLVEVARRLKAAVRETDLVGRLGGDEFAVIAEGAGSRLDIEMVARRLLQSLSEPHALDGASRRATPSIGIVLHDDGDEDGSALRARADAAMYRAKSLGKAQWAWGEPAAAPEVSVAGDTDRGRVPELPEREVRHGQPRRG